MKPSEVCKAAGLYNLNELADLTGTAPQVLIRWHKEKPRLFNIVVLGAVQQKIQNAADYAADKARREMKEIGEKLS